MARDAGRRRPDGRPRSTCEERTRAQTAPCDLHYLFAPLKHERLDYMVQKAVELGVSRLVPVITQHVQVTRVNLERMRANAIEAAEQCGILNLAEIADPLTFKQMIAGRDAERLLVFCDEDADVHDPVAALVGAAARARRGRSPCSIGPEGGFAEEERARLLQSAERGAARARTTHPARGYGGGRGAHAGASGARRLALILCAHRRERRLQ